MNLLLNIFPSQNLNPLKLFSFYNLDTLDVPIDNYISFRDIVGNSPNDIWLGNLQPGLWHYDGNNWENVQFPELTPSALCLFEDNTLWVGTSQNSILKRENGIWTEKFDLEFEDYDIIDVFGMYGKEKNNIYAVGMVNKTIIPGEEYENKAIILHYDGHDWEFLDIPNLDGVGFHRISYQNDLDLYFIFANKFKDGILRDKLFTFDGENLSEVLSTPGSISLSKLNGVVYINHDFKVYKYKNNKLELWKDFTGTEFISNFVGRGENDFFNRSKNGVGHYNGVDYKTIYPTHLEIYTKVIFEKEVFITAFDFYNKHYIIIHGTLKE